MILLGCVYMALNIPQYGLSFFLPQIVKAFGVTNVQAGFITALPYVVGALGMIVWSRHSDKTGERVWHCVIPFLAMVVGLGLAASIADPTAKIVRAVHRGLGLLLDPAGVLDAADRLLERRRRGGRHRRGQFDRQSRGLFRPASVRISQDVHRRRHRRA